MCEGDFVVPDVSVLHCIAGSNNKGHCPYYPKFIIVQSLRFFCLIELVLCSCLLICFYRHSKFAVIVDLAYLNASCLVKCYITAL